MLVAIISSIKTGTSAPKIFIFANINVENLSDIGAKYCSIYWSIPIPILFLLFRLLHLFKNNQNIHQIQVLY